MKRTHLSAVVGLAAAACLVAPAAMSGAAPGDADLVTPGQQQALDLGIQVAPKGETASLVKGAATPNPYLANLPDLTKADYATWIQRMARGAEVSAQLGRSSPPPSAAVPGAAAAPVVHDEEEPAGTAGSNDTVANAEPHHRRSAPRPPGTTGCGSSVSFADLGAGTSRTSRHRRGQRLDHAGRPTPLIDGSGAVETDSVLGDGPHGSAGDGSNDFDFYTVDVAAGQSILANTEGSPTGIDTVVAVYDAAGRLLAADDDGGTGVLSTLTYTPEAAGTYYVLVGGLRLRRAAPRRPVRLRQRQRRRRRGRLPLRRLRAAVDADYYSVRLRPGDVVGGVGNGVATGLSHHHARRRGAGRRASALDASSSTRPPLRCPAAATRPWLRRRGGRLVRRPGHRDTAPTT